jgi:hypothetical protein
VSLLSPDTLCVFVSPTALHALVRGGWRRSLGPQRVYPIEATHSEPWVDLLANFSQMVSEFKCSHVSVVLSHHLVQYQLLPWREDLADDSEYLALARLEFSSVFGEMSDAWSYAISDDTPGVARLACAVPTALLQGLTAAASESGAKLVALQPYFAAVARRWVRQLSGVSPQWLVLHEAGRLCLAVRQSGAWRWVRHVRVDSDWPRQLPAILKSEAQLAGLAVEPSQVHVLAPVAAPGLTQGLQSLGYRQLVPSNERGFNVDTHGVFYPAWLA